jgi:hypothetical protein
LVWVDPHAHTHEVRRLLATWVAAGLVGGSGIAAAAPPTRDPDSRDHGEFWSEVVAPNHDQVGAIKSQLRDALAVIASDWNPEHRERVIADATRAARHARSLDPGDVEVVFYLGALADEGGRTTDAVRLLTEVSQRAPRGAVRGDALVRLGKIALRRGRPGDAIAPLRQAMGERPERRTTTIAAV